jgi:glycosyltransferase involved in cell wall biosynthesis
MPIQRIILAVSSLSAGGAERVISEMANAWAEQGKDVAVLTISGIDVDHYQLLPSVSRIALNLLWDSCSIWQSMRGNFQRSLDIRRAVRSFRPDVVVSFIDQTNVRLLAALIASGIPVVVSERIDPRRYRVGMPWEWARRLLYPLADGLVVQTPSVAPWAGKIVPSSRVRVIPNFVRELPTQSLFKYEDKRLVLAVGRLVPQKGFDLLIRSFAKSQAAANGYQLTILGEGPARPHLEALARTEGVSDAVFLPGVVAEPAEWMAQASVFVLPSRFEGFPNALLEAMAMGCAVIASNCDSGPAEIVRDGENGLLVPPEDVKALTSAIRRLLDDAEYRQALGEAALEVRQRFSRATQMARWNELIQAVTENRGLK